jgi:hypothetical protein
VEVTEEGAVYRPAEEIEPMLGLRDQLTAVLVAPVTVAANCRDCDAVRVAEVGLTLTLTGLPGGANVTTAVSYFVASATLVALTVTVCVEIMEEGAVYKPLEEMLPTVGLIDQVTAVLDVSITVALNCFV